MTRNDVFVGDRRVLRRYIGDRLIFDDLSNKTDILSGNEIFTDKADEGAAVHVEVDGKSYQHVNPNARNMIPTAYKDWEDGHYSPSGTKEPYIDRIRVPRLVKVEPSTTYYWNSGNSSAQFVIRSFDSSGAFSGSWGGVSSSGSRATSSSDHYLGIALFNTSDYEEKFSNGTIKPLFQLASHSDKSFEEFIPPDPTPDYPIEIHSLNDFDVVSSVEKLSEGQLEEYNYDTEYENIYKINLSLSEPLRSVGDVKDRIYRDSDGLWKVERNIEVTGTEDGTQSIADAYSPYDVPVIEVLSAEYQNKLSNLRSFQDSNYLYTIVAENLKPTLHATFKSIGWETFRKKVTKEREQ